MKTLTNEQVKLLRTYLIMSYPQYKAEDYPDILMLLASMINSPDNLMLRVKVVPGNDVLAPSILGLAPGDIIHILNHPNGDTTSYTITGVHFEMCIIVPFFESRFTLVERNDGDSEVVSFSKVTK